MLVIKATAVLTSLTCSFEGGQQWCGYDCQGPREEWETAAAITGHADTRMAAALQGVDIYEVSDVDELQHALEQLWDSMRVSLLQKPCEL